MKLETKQASPGFSLIVEVFITSGHIWHILGISDFLKQICYVYIIDSFGIAILQNRKSSRILSCSTFQVLIFLLHLSP